jgi:hypothetical protein
MKTKVVLGDWSHDGHGITDLFVIDLPTVTGSDELDSFYAIGTEIVGFNLTKEVCSNYEDNVVDIDKYTKLVELGYLPYSFKKTESKWGDELPEYSEYDGRCGYWICKEVFLDLYMFIVSLGYKHVIGSSESFTYYVVSDTMPNVNIGGYGLFYC